jgi:predicted nucleic acid-binding protein
MTSADAVNAISSIAESCHVIAADQGAHHIATAFIQKHLLTGDKIFDAYLAATALSVGVNTIATDNVKDLQIFEGVKVVNPFTVKPGISSNPTA